MADYIRTFTVLTSPETIIRGQPGDLFYRTGSLFYFCPKNAGKISRLEHKLSNFLTKYDTPFYDDTLIELQYTEELWEKKDNTGTDTTGWKFSKGAFFGQSVGFFINIDLIGGASPTPTFTPTFTSTPTNTTTLTPSISFTPTITPTITAEETPTFTPTLTPTFTPTATLSPTMTPTQTNGLGVSLKARYVMNEGTGSVIYDSVGTTTGSMFGFAAPPTAISGWSGSITSSLLFDGTNDYVIMSGSGISLTSQSFTISAWARRLSTGTWDIIYSQGTQTLGHQLLIFGYTPGSSFILSFYGDDMNEGSWGSDTGSWVHWAASYDLQTNGERLYRNGQLISTRTASSFLNATDSSSIGSRLPDTDAPGEFMLFNGSIKNVRLYGRVLNDSEVLDIYTLES